jgi:methionyl aminopeptidase
MEEEVLQNYIKAGKIAAEVREESREMIKPGVPLLELAEKIEALIKSKGALPAFPVNLSLNQKAAHYTPSRNDKTIFTEKDILKVDIGVHIDGFIGDTAYSFSLNPDHAELIKASQSALETAIKLCIPDTLLSDISTTIEDTIKAAGFKPVSNLTGHGLDQFDLHAEPQVPNIKFSSDYKIKENQILAIEPFATNGAGRIKDTSETLIFSFIPFNIKPTRNIDARKLLEFASRFEGLPFAERWLEKELGFSQFKLKLALRDLTNSETINPYPVLSEIENGLVSQAEHTIIVRDKPIITTL